MDPVCLCIYISRCHLANLTARLLFCLLVTPLIVCLTSNLPACLDLWLPLSLFIYYHHFFGQICSLFIFSLCLFGCLFAWLFGRLNIRLFVCVYMRMEWLWPIVCLQISLTTIMTTFSFPQVRAYGKDWRELHMSGEYTCTRNILARELVVREVHQGTTYIIHRSLRVDLILAPTDNVWSSQYAQVVTIANHISSHPWDHAKYNPRPSQHTRFLNLLSSRDRMQRGSVARRRERKSLAASLWVVVTQSAVYVYSCLYTHWRVLCT